LCETLGDDSRERRAQFGLIEIVLRDALAHLRLLQLSRQHCELRLHLVELRLRDRAADFLKTLHLALRIRALRIDACDFGLRILDAQAHGFVLELRHALAFAHARADLGDVCQPSCAARGESRIVAAHDPAGHPAPRRDARDFSLRDFHHDARLLRRWAVGGGARCGKRKRRGERECRYA
jgi:hypothetical protein